MSSIIDRNSDDGCLYVIGLTGNIAVGKSTVLGYLAGKGAHVIDADKMAHQTMLPDGAAYEKVVSEFGETILEVDGSINRTALGAIVFADQPALERLEAIVHPATFELIRWNMSQTTSDVVVLEAIKLLESGRVLTLCDEIWVVTARLGTQIQRLIEFRNMGEMDAHQRMAAQSSQAEKLANADRVVENDGTVEELYGQLDIYWEQMLERKDQVVSSVANSAFEE
jgi:dephospho-CoA kinase